MFAVLLLYALFGMSVTFSKMLLYYTQPMFAVGIRMTLAGLMLMGYIFAKHRISCYPQRADFRYYIQLIIFLIFLPHTLRLWALQYMPTGKVSFLFNLAPFFAAVLSYFFNKERFNGWQIIGLIIGFIGMIPILWTSSPGEIHFTDFQFLSLSELAIIASVASMSYGLIITQRMVKHRKCPTYLANGVCMLFGGLLALNLSFVAESNLIKHSGGWPIIALLVTQVLLSNVVCYNLQASLLKRYSTTFMSFAGFLSSLFTALYGYLLFGEVITWHFLASLAIVIIGLALYRYNDGKGDTEYQELNA